ncbi:MAG: TOBE domain-containing protein, partial [Chloroflexota bacterium]|nr:TOBE domain-containing protein [Chloroflexota bacterium]
SQFVANFLGSSNLLEATVIGPSAGLWCLETPAGQLRAACPEGVKAGDHVTVSVRPESLAVYPQRPASGNILEAEVTSFMFLGESAECRLRTGASVLRARQSPNASFSRGDTVYLQIPEGSCTIISDEHGVSSPNYRESETA